MKENRLLLLALAVFITALALIVLLMISPVTAPLASIGSVIQPASSHAVFPWLAAATIGSSLLSGIFGSSSQNKANKANIQMQRETNELNYKINQENNAWSRQMAFDMFNAENEYNNPEAQKQRLMDAGYNPAALVENGASVATADGSTPVAQSPNPMIAPQVAPIPSPLMNVFDNMSKIASAFESVNSGNLKGEQKKFVLEQAKTEVLKQKQIEIDNAIQQLYGFKEADARVNEIGARIDKLRNEIYLNVLKGNQVVADTQLTHLQKIAQENANTQWSSTIQYIVAAAKEQVNLLKAEISTEGTKQKAYTSQAHASEAQAGLSEATTKTINSKRFFEVGLTKELWTQAKNNTKFSGSTLEARIKEAIDKSELPAWQKEMYKKQVERAGKENDYYEVNMVLEHIEKFADIGAKYTDALVPF